MKLVPRTETTPSPTPRILLVEDNATVRRLIKAILVQRHPEWEIFEAENGSEAIAKLVEVLPDLVLLDLSLPDMSAHEAVRGIRKCAPGVKIVFCSSDDSGSLAIVAQRLGADGYITKSDAFALLEPKLDALMKTKRV